MRLLPLPMEPGRAGRCWQGWARSPLDRLTSWAALPLCALPGKLSTPALGGGSEGLGPAEEAGQRGQEQCPSSVLRGRGPCGLSAEALRPGEPGLPGKTMVAYSVCSGTQGAGGSGVSSRHWKSSSP